MKDDGDDVDAEPLDQEFSRKYRRIAAVVNFMSMDRPDLQYSASVLGRYMSRPTANAWARLKRVGRYILRHPALTYEFKRAKMHDVGEAVAWSDSDWAGCRVTRRSMSGGLITLGDSVIKSWANRQASVALSSGEAEFYAAGKAAA